MISYLLNEYCEKNTSPQLPELQELERVTHLNTTQPNMLSGHLQGQFLIFLSQWIRPKMALEIGTFTGYSAICLAQGLEEGGRLHTIDTDEERLSIAQRFFEKYNYTDRITIHPANALDVIPTFEEESLDLVFIDADKESYSIYYDIVFPKVRKGGWIIADNVLWKGKVIDAQPDKKTSYLIDFNAKIQADNRVSKLLLPLRDGLFLIQKL